ncbi:MAG: polysaccharide deacetylase family protein [Candidatus Nitrosocosmicus sp.]
MANSSFCKVNIGIVILIIIVCLLSVSILYKIEAKEQKTVRIDVSSNNQVRNGNHDGKGIDLLSNSSRVAIITFDDGYKSQFTNAKPILTNYGYNASFFIVCNFVGKTAEQMNTSSIVDFIGRGVEQMSWNDIISLYKQGYQIGAHTMNHLRNLTNMSNSELDYEIGHSKQCLADHGIFTKTFAYPFENGKYNSTIVEDISKYYSYARAGSYPLMFLHCNHYKSHPQNDCKTFLPDGKVSLANRYSILGWSHDGDRRKYSYNDTQMFDRFVEVVNSQDKYNKFLSGQKSLSIESVPIIIYHRVDNSGEPYSTTLSLFSREMKYLHDNGFRVISLDSLVYDNNTNFFYLKN